MIGSARGAWTSPPRRRFAGVLPVALLLLLGATPLRAEEVEGDDIATVRARHLLRRATFGPRPADVEEVKRLGIEAWLDRQLNPEQIPDPELDRRLEGFETLKMSTAEYRRMLAGGAMDAATQGPPGPGEDRIAAARRRQAEINRLQNLARQEVPQAVFLRAAYSERQLFEVLCEFWRNHFNVDVNKDDVRYYIQDYEREVIGRHVLGRFEDFLMATARHPAMLFYLDNHVSQAPMARAERVRAGREDESRTGGLNENYARELMELHTVGADNGYEQDDVIQLALALTGWSIQGGNGPDAGTFVFRQNFHARGRKRVMGKTVGGDDLEEGEALVRYLAGHKNTAPFVVGKLCRYLVTDQPPEKLVADVVGVWQKTKGDLKAVTRAILLHPLFYDRANVLTKARTPFEFAVAAVRATRADVKDCRALLQRIGDMGQPVLECEDPTGYSDAAADWMDTGVLAVRWQFAYDLVNGRLPGVDVGASPIQEHVRRNPEVWEYLLQQDLFAGERIGSLTMAPFRKRLQAVRKDYRRMRPPELQQAFNVLVTLLLGSPEFQRQ